MNQSQVVPEKSKLQWPRFNQLSPKRRASIFDTTFLNKLGSTPSQKKVWTVIIGFLMISLIVCIIWFINKPTHWGFDESIPKGEMGINGFYYWATVTSTVGFGDICPKTKTAKLITALYQMFVAGVSFGLILKITDEHLTINKSGK